MTEIVSPSGWQIPEGYYENIAKSTPNAFIHWAGRALIAPYRYALYGAPVIDTSPGFDAAQENGDFDEGNLIIASTHRSGEETVFQPAVFESLGFHHARPLSKKERNMDHPVVRWGMHQLGAFAVDKKNPDIRAVSATQVAILGRKGIMTIYIEGTRIYDDISRVHTPQNGAIFTAIEKGSLIIPHAVAGMSKMKVGEKPHQRTIARDERAYLGRSPHNVFDKGLPVVYAFGDPIKFEKPDFTLSLERGAGRLAMSRSRAYINECSMVLREGLQTVLARAYEVRGSSLEQRFD